MGLIIIVDLTTMGERNCRVKTEIKGCAIKWRKFELSSLDSARLIRGMTTMETKG